MVNIYVIKYVTLPLEVLCRGGGNTTGMRTPRPWAIGRGMGFIKTVILELNLQRSLQHQGKEPSLEGAVWI